MSTELLTLITILIIAAVAIFAFTKYKESKSYNGNGIPLGMESQYELAINPGSDGKPLMYNLTTCNHCVRVHDYLEKHDIDHNDIVVDYFAGKARTEIINKIRTYNPKVSFPTLVFPNGRVVVGFREKALQEAIDAEKNALQAQASHSEISHDDTENEKEKQENL